MLLERRDGDNAGEGAAGVGETGGAAGGSAILRAVRIMETIAASGVPLQLAQICREVGLPKPTVFRILSTLEQAGLVGREPGEKRYTCSERLNALAGNTLLNSPNRAARRAVLEELVEQVGETCNLVIANNNAVLYLDRVEVSWPLRVALGAGSRLPLYASASGKLFLSNMPKRSRDRFLSVTPLIPHTPNTLVDRTRLAREFDAIRASGYAVDDEEYLSGVCCVAVPVRTAENRLVAALALHAPVSRMPLAQALEYLPQLRQSAEAIAQTIDW